MSLLPEDLVRRLHEASVDQDAVARGERGNFKLFNLQTGQDDFMTPSGDSPRHRFGRENLRKLLMDGLDIEVCYSRPVIYLRIINLFG